MGMDDWDYDPSHHEPPDSYEDWYDLPYIKKPCKKCGTTLVGRGCPQCQTLANSLTTETLAKALRPFEGKEIKVKVGKHSCEYCPFRRLEDMTFYQAEFCTLFGIRVPKDKPCKECKAL